MENTQAVTTTSNTTATQAIPSAAPTVKVSAVSKEFDGMLKALISPSKDGNISEEELFAGLVRERIAAVKGEDAAVKYDTLLKDARASLTSPDGFVQHERAAVRSLRALVKDGSLTSEEGDSIYSQAFSGAQLDSNTDVLWDNRSGGANDPTKAVEAMEAALTAAKLQIEKLSTDSSTLKTRSLFDDSSLTASGFATSSAQTLTKGVVPDGTITPQGTKIDGTDGFLFKPISNNEGKLAVLLPSAMKQLVESVLLKDSNGNVLGEGRSTGFGDDGSREKFAFGKKGGDYPKDITVEVKLSSGKVVSYKIPDPSQRYD